MVVRWDTGWHEVRFDDREERIFVSENGGEVMRAAIPMNRTAERMASRLDDAEYRRMLEGDSDAD